MTRFKLINDLYQVSHAWSMHVSMPWEVENVFINMSIVLLYKHFRLVAYSHCKLALLYPINLFEQLHLFQADSSSFDNNQEGEWSKEKENNR
jgi:hypothetical protein